MNAASQIPGSRGGVETDADCAWSFKHRWVLISIVFALHVGLIFAFGDRKPVVPKPPAPGLTVTHLPDSASLADIENPTLLALPHRQSFAGQLALEPVRQPIEAFHWTEPPRFLPLTVDALEDAFEQFKQANAAVPFDLVAKAPAALTIPSAYQTFETTPRRSTLRLARGLAGRRLLDPPQLSAQRAPGLLTNTVVQVLVSADGQVLSALLQLPGSGSESSDREALRLARDAHFEPTPVGKGTQVVGLMIFDWATVPTVNTNATTP